MMSYKEKVLYVENDEIFFSCLPESPTTIILTLSIAAIDESYQIFFIM